MSPRPPTSGYARLEQYESDSEDDHEITSQIRLSEDTQYAPIQAPRAPRARFQTSRSGSYKSERGGGRTRSNSAIDIKALNHRLEKWAEEIAQKFKIRKVQGKTQDEEKLEIHHSVFQGPEGMRPAAPESFSDMEGRMSKLEFDDVVESVRVAMEMGMHPKMITQGSSGSYFAQNSEGKVVGVFKPKDEEPYATKNPKWTKWIHRNLFPFAFGRACLIPNLSYVSEAAAYVLDSRLQTNIVPYTDIVEFSSISFNYDYWDRKAYYRKKKPLPPKIGSLQVFLKGFQDATVFLKEHPWPDQATGALEAGAARRNKKRGWTAGCRPGDEQSDEEEEHMPTTGRSRSRGRRAFWTPALQLSLKEELEKLVILDYIMRNTDRGLDNWMIRIDEETQKATIVADVTGKDSKSTHPDESANGNSDPYTRRDQSMSANGTSTPEPRSGPKVVLGAIDNSLSWPWKHPDAWRSFPFGWLFLPVSLIGQPFTEKTRQHFLPLLTSKQWWSETQVALRACFSQDADFQEKMFARQIAVMKGQAWNVVETLKERNQGPLELTRRARVCVWDDLVDIPVVVPMRVPSVEIRRRQDASTRREEQEELDISAARGETSQNGIAGPGISAPANLPTSVRFDLARSKPGDEFPTLDEENNSKPLLPVIGETSPFLAPENSEGTDRIQLVARNRPPKIRSRLSYEEPRPRVDMSGDRRKRNLSFSTRRVETDDDGDLGYGAAQDMESSMKRVIVERIELVKSRNPVFTWC